MIKSNPLKMLNGNRRMNLTKIICCYQYKTSGKHRDSGNGLNSTALRLKVYGVNKTGDGSGIVVDDTLLGICSLNTTGEYIAEEYASSTIVGLVASNYTAIYYTYDYNEAGHKCVDLLRINNISLILDAVENSDSYQVENSTPAKLPISLVWFSRGWTEPAEDNNNLHLYAPNIFKIESITWADGDPPPTPPPVLARVNGTLGITATIINSDSLDESYPTSVRIGFGNWESGAEKYVDIEGSVTTFPEWKGSVLTFYPYSEWGEHFLFLLSSLPDNSHTTTERKSWTGGSIEKWYGI